MGFDDIKKAVGEGASAACKMAGDIANKTKIKFALANLQDDVDELYEKLGKLHYEAVAFGADRAKAVATFAFIYSVMGTLNAFLRGYGVSVAPAVINIFALFVFRLIWSFAYFPHHRTLFHLYISYPIGWLIAIVMLLVIYRPAMGKAMERLEAEARERAG